MILTRLELASIRNYATLEFEPAAGLNVVVGANAQGKSNLLEAIGLVATGKSLRTTHESELIREGSVAGSAIGEARIAAGSVRLGCTLALQPNGLRKRFTLNGSAVRYAAYLGNLRAVTFLPADLQLVTGPPALRRSLLNAALAQESRTYYAALAEYRRQVAQKNALLREGEPVDRALLGAYHERMIETGTRLILARRAFVAALAERARATYRAWAGGADGDLELEYRSNVDVSVPTADAVAASFESELRQRQALEFARRAALVGPQRDDVVFLLDGKPLAAFGSQGQQRTAVLALKVAEYATLEARSGEAPILLLDDVLSELDAARRDAFLHGVAGAQQAFLTTTAEVDVPAAAAFRVRAARVEAA